jgi:hypothetical protein
MNTLAVLVEDMLYLKEGVPDKIVNLDVEKQLTKLAGEIQTSQFIRIAEFLRTIEVHSNNYGNRQMLTDVLALTANATLSERS